MDWDEKVAHLATQIGSAGRTAESLGFSMAAHLLQMARLEVDLNELALPENLAPLRQSRDNATGS